MHLYRSFERVTLPASAASRAAPGQEIRIGLDVLDERVHLRAYTERARCGLPCAWHRKAKASLSRSSAMRPDDFRNTNSTPTGTT